MSKGVSFKNTLDNSLLDLEDDKDSELKEIENKTSRGSDYARKGTMLDNRSKVNTEDKDFKKSKKNAMGAFKSTGLKKVKSEIDESIAFSKYDRA